MPKRKPEEKSGEGTKDKLNCGMKTEQKDGRCTLKHSETKWQWNYRNFKRKSCATSQLAVYSYHTRKMNFLRLTEISAATNVMPKSDLFFAVRKVQNAGRMIWTQPILFVMAFFSTCRAFHAAVTSSEQAVRVVEWEHAKRMNDWIKPWSLSTGVITLKNF